MSREPDASNDGRRLPRRATDRVEDAVACVLLAAAFVVLVVAWSSGTAVYRADSESTSTTNQTKAVLLEDAQAVDSAEGVGIPLWVDARWADRTGAEHTGRIRVMAPAPAGTQVDVWISSNGTAGTSPPGHANAVTAGVITGAGLLFAGGCVLATLWFGVRFLTNARNYHRWGREWARVGPEWSGRSL